MELASDAPSIGETWSEMEKIFASGKAKAIGEGDPMGHISKPYFDI